MPRVPKTGDLTKVVAWLVDTRTQYVNAKKMFTTQYDILSQYFFQMKKGLQPLSATPSPQGEFLNDGSITDNIGAFAARNMASALMASIWKGEARTVQVMPDRAIRIDDNNKKYFVTISQNFADYLDRTEARFEQALDCSLLESVVYGTSGMGVQRGDFVSPLRYHQQSVLYFYLGYDEDGAVDTIITDRHRNAKELVDEYGISKLPGVVQTAYRTRDMITHFTVSKYIGPRSMFRAAKGRLSMPFVMFEFMPNEQFFMSEGGFESFPIPILFFSKLDHEDYGRSPAMDALPTVQQANVVTEILAEGGEATAKPPLGLYDNGSLAGKVVDLSGGALSVFNVSGSIPTEKPIFPLFVVGDLTVMLEWSKLLREWVGQFFLLDKLYDLPTQQRMTTKEVGVRDRNQSRSQTSYNSQSLRFLTQTFERSLDILFDMGLLGVKDPNNPLDPKVIALKAAGVTPIKIPGDVWVRISSGQNWYNLQYISPAARLMRSDAFQSATGFLQVIADLSQFIPAFQDTINVAGTAQKLQELQSTDLVMINTPDQVAAIQEARRRAQQEAAELEKQKIQAIANQSNAQAAAAQAGAVSTMTKLNQPGE